ncbi:MAG: VOC family protein [Terracidiphilus sp.]|jgi:predicted enzyme related to lactoylglutathione lyase
MSKPAQHHKINYIEFTTPDIELTKKFYSTVFGWSFKDWGPHYIDASAESTGVAIGFAKGAPLQQQPGSAPMAVLYSTDLKATEEAVLAAGGSIAVPTFDFPGGRRFHFSDGLGNVLGVWSEQAAKNE